MSKSSKQEINYRLPTECCGVCISSYYNTYGDACCERLEHHDVIEVGGVCDFFTNTPTVSIVNDTPSELDNALENVEEVVRGNCENCKHSYFSGTAPMCGVDNVIIEDVHSTCNAWEQEG